MSAAVVFAVWAVACYGLAKWLDRRRGRDLGRVQITGSHWQRRIADEVYRKAGVS